MDRKLDFTKRLLSYSAVGPAAALGAGQAQGGIIANTTPQSLDVRIGFGTFAFINF